ncbi:MAG: N-acetylmuramoyl-L-alanine amidase [Victivallales bacterium]|nr:N-acetylmuramoyl-L-alanine amidase [Victivallales bacterium]
MHKLLSYAIIAILACFCTVPMLCAAPKQPQPQARDKTIHVVTIDKVQYLYLDDVARFYGFTMTVNGKNITLSSRFSRLVFKVDGRIATINTIDQYLAFSVRLAKEHYLLSLIDFQKVIDPILRPATIPRHNVRTIVIDAGHGGKDPGCMNGVIKEKNITLQVAHRLANLLKKRGYNVIMTRQTDIYPTLDQRVNATNKIKPDLYISLHCNATANAAVSGIEVYCATAAGSAPSDSKVISNRTCVSNAYDLENAFLAYHVQKRLVSATQAVDRGARHKRFKVIADTNAPCILIEMGFLTNQAECQALSQPQRQMLTGTAIANAIEEYKNAVSPRMPRPALSPR